MLLICECIEYVKFCFFCILLNKIDEGFFLNIMLNIIKVVYLFCLYCVGKWYFIFNLVWFMLLYLII